MAVEILVTDNWQKFTMDIWVSLKRGADREIYKMPIGGNAAQWIPLPMDGAIHEEIEPTIRIPMDSEIGLALTHALVRHYSGTDDTRELRKDYEHMRNELAIAQARHHELAMRAIDVMGEVGRE